VEQGAKVATALRQRRHRPFRYLQDQRNHQGVSAKMGLVAITTSWCALARRLVIAARLQGIAESQSTIVQGFSDGKPPVLPAGNMSLTPA
jgi:hypothetical protein